jgi:hypothetical protein
MLTQRQEEIIVGTILGDGYLENRGTANSRLQIRHAISQREYVDWIYGELAALVAKSPRQIHEAYFFRTRSYKFLTYLRQKFYPQGVKIVPEDIFLSPLSLAIWFMDDGYVDQNAAYFCTHSFDSESLRRIQNLLLRYDLATSLIKDRNHYKTRITVASTKKFIQLVKPYIIPSLLYKIRIAP